MPKKGVEITADEEMKAWEEANTTVSSNGKVSTVDNNISPVLKGSYQASPASDDPVVIPGFETPLAALQWAAEVAKDNVFIRDSITDVLLQMKGH